MSYFLFWLISDNKSDNTEADQDSYEMASFYRLPIDEVSEESNEERIRLEYDDQKIEWHQHQRHVHQEENHLPENRSGEYKFELTFVNIEST